MLGREPLCHPSYLSERPEPGQPPPTTTPDARAECGNGLFKNPRNLLSGGTIVGYSREDYQTPSRTQILSGKESRRTPGRNPQLTIVSRNRRQHSRRKELPTGPTAENYSRKTDTNRLE